MLPVGQKIRGALGQGEDWRATRRLLLAGVGAVYFAAFLSLGVQVHGLVGSQGILPNERVFSVLLASDEYGFADAPSLCLWLGCSDAALSALYLAGALASCLLVAGALPLGAAVIAWLCYLSLLHAGQVFFSFQWDVLLLETGFLSILLAPPGALLPTAAHWQGQPSRVAVLLFRWLLFRLIFSSGAVKLASGDPTWHSLEALSFHYWTQPLPDSASWYAAQLPLALQRLSTLLLFVLELGAPLLFFAPRRARLLGAAATAGLMGVIAATGNYGFFNLLTLVLCVSLLDDRALPQRLRRFLAGEAPGLRATTALARLRTRWPLAVTAPVALCLVIASLVPFVGGAFRQRLSWPAPVLALHAAQRPFLLTNSYGLFARMTTTRHEINIEGSRDGIEWRTYLFRHKPGPLARAPSFVAPHMPRLDWQMWFAALGPVQESPWLFALCARLLEGSPPVLALLEQDPFPGEPPRYLRARLSDYRFSDWTRGRETGEWWQSRDVALYLAPVRLAPGGSGRLERAFELDAGG